MEDGGRFAVVPLPRLTPYVFGVVRDYIYTDAVDIRRWQAPAVARAARALGLPMLVRAAEAISRSRRPELESSFVEDMRTRGLGDDSVRCSRPFPARAASSAGAVPVLTLCGSTHAQVHNVTCVLDSGEVVSAHRTVLCCNSDFFGALFALVRTHGHHQRRGAPLAAY